MDAKEYDYLRRIYGRELDLLELTMFESIGSIVDLVAEGYRDRGFCLRDRIKAIRVFHRVIRENFLAKLYDQVKQLFGTSGCQTAQDFSEMFPLPSYTSEEIAEKSHHHAEILLKELEAKSPEDLEKTIWARVRLSNLEKMSFSPRPAG